MKQIILTLVFTLIGLVFAQDEALLQQVMQAQLDAPKTRANIVSTSAGGVASLITVDFVAPDSFHMTTKSADVVISDMILMAGKTYLYDPSNGWSLSPMDLSSAVMSVRNSDMIKETTLSNIQRLPDEDLNGKPCLLYSYGSSYQGIGSQNKIWIEKASMLPLRLESESEYTGAKTQTVIDYSYEDSIEINAPE